MFCTNCGKQIKDDSKFCPYCGKVVEIHLGSSNSPGGQQPLGNGAESITVSVNNQKAESFDEKRKKEGIKQIQKTLEFENPGESGGEKKRNFFLTMFLVILAILALFLSVIAGIFVAGSGGVSEALVVAGEDGITGVADVIVEQVGGGRDRLSAREESEEENQSDSDSEDSEAGTEDDLVSRQDGSSEEGPISRKDENTKEDTAIQEDESDAAQDKKEKEGADKKAGEKTPVDITVRQVDNSKFPQITFYANVEDKQGGSVSDLDEDDFTVQEVEGNGQLVDVNIDKVYQVMDHDRVNINLVLDKSGSMDSQSRMDKAKGAATAFLEKVRDSDKVEVISFDDYVYLEQNFTDNIDLVKEAVDGINTGGDTAVYDALYSGIYDTYYQNGAKCVIGFTDGEENASSHTFEEVVELSQSTGIPVFIIGIGNSYDESSLIKLAAECSGEYYNVGEVDMESVMEDIYSTIYREQQDYYVFEYTSPEEKDKTSEREIVLKTSADSEFTGEYRKKFVPVADLTGGFSSDYADKDFMIPDSSSRAITDADLAGMSLAELRIARNEIFARHGRQFKDSMLNKWFYSKQWYLEIPAKYSPSDFDSKNPNKLSKLEIANVEKIQAFEQLMMNSQDIFPDAAKEPLSDYDIALSKEVLKRALSQLKGMGSTQVLMDNINKVQEAIAADEIVC